MSALAWRLRHLHEFFWEPIMKWWHRNRQARIERDYWYERLQEVEKREADYRERYQFQWEMRCKAEDELGHREAEDANVCHHELDLMERSWPWPRDGTTWLHCKRCQKHVWTVSTRLLA